MNFRFRLLSVTAGAVLAGALSAEAQPTSWIAEHTRWQDAGIERGGEVHQLGRLKDMLDRYREIERRGGWKGVPTDLVMGPGYSYDCRRVVAVENRLVAEGYLDPADRTRPPAPPPPPPPSRWYEKDKPLPKPKPPMCRYSRALEEAVKKFQADRKILGVGQVAKQTMTEMNRPVGEIIDILEHDVDRWRRVSIDPSGTTILVTIPFFELQVFERGREQLRMPVIVGQPSWQTPQFNATVQHIIVNPSWGIPPKIAKLEYWPSAKRNPRWLSSQGIVDEGGSLRQKPGPNNPLGRIKFVMPNEHDVYLHDTPYKKAFNAAVKALSHGCVRLSQPMDLADYLLSDQPQWTGERLQRAIASGATQQINLVRKMPVTIVYATSRVNDEGRLELRKDVYGKNTGRVRRTEDVLGEDKQYLDSGP